PGGRPSRSRITLKDDAGTHQTFWSATTWDALGQAKSFEYPECNGSWRLDCTAKTRVVETAYHAANRRLLKKVSTTYNGGPAGDLAANVTYFDDQRLKQITFGGGPLTYQVFTAHPQLPGRYERESICTQAACQHFDPLVYDGDGRLVRQVLGPILPDDRRSLPTGPPAPSANRPTRAELVAAVDGGTPPACPVTSHDALGKLTHVDRCTGGAEPRHLFYAYDAQDRRLWTVGSNDGVNHTTWESRFELRDRAGRTVRRYERLSNTLTQVEDYVYAGPTLVGYVRGWSSQVGEGDRFYVHTDLAGRPHMKHRVENGQVVEWSAW
ncbi:MAG TPA: hypothetical protein VKU40_15470, partial [Thermoanaerobaculia bacterium]|nr:hypothetical protein [Thermoanaerobaculia bacterium]